MEMIEKFFKPLLLIGAIGWMGLAVTHTLNEDQLLCYIGVMSILMGVRNLLILNISHRTGVYHEKIQSYIDRFGLRDGLIRYGVLLVGAYLVLGVVLVLFMVF